MGFKNQEMAERVIDLSRQLEAVSELVSSGLSDDSLGRTLSLDGEHEFTQTELFDALRKVGSMARRVARPGS